MFSPYYAHARHARRRSHAAVDADPLDHCTINVALYGEKGRRWSMTERRRDDVHRSATRLAIGPSSLEWVGDSLRLHLDEVSAPVPRRIRGTIDVRPGARPAHRVSLDEAGRHRWGVIAPCARIDVALSAPTLAWSGSAYLDSNRGTRPLEDDFDRWNWSRAHLADGRTAVVYDVVRSDGSERAISDCFGIDGGVEPFAAPPVARLPRTLWGLDRSTRSDPSVTPTVRSSLEDGPFYSRSVTQAHWLGQPVTAVHEYLSMQRFERRWVRALLPFRMPRRW